MSESDQAKSVWSEDRLVVLTPHSAGGMAMGTLLFVLFMTIGGLTMLFFGATSVGWWHVPLGIAMFAIGLLSVPSKRRPSGMRAFSGSADASYRRAG